MAISTFYSFDSIESIDPGFTTHYSDAASLDGGGLAFSGYHDGATIFDSDGEIAGRSTWTTGWHETIAQLSNGNIVIAASGGGPYVFNTDIVFTIVNSVGDTVVTTTGIGESAGNFRSTDVAGGLTGGRFAIVYENSDPSVGDEVIKVDIRNNDGGSFDNFVIVMSDGVDDPKIATLEDGGFAVAWTRWSGDDTEMWYAVYDGDGSARRLPSLLDSSGDTNRGASVVALDNGGFAIAYEDSDRLGGTDTDIALARFDADGDFIDSNDISQNTVNDSDPSATVLSNGMIAVGSTTDSFADINVRWTLVDQNTGAKLGTSVSGFSGADDGWTSVAAMNLGQLGVFFSTSDTDVVNGQVLQARRVSTGDVANNTIIGDDLVDVVYGGGGADTIRGGLNVDDLNGDGGNDTFQFATGEVGFGETVNGGADFDRVVALSDISFVDANLASIEEIEFSTVNTATTLVSVRSDQIGAGLAASLLVDGNATDVSDMLLIEMGADTSVSLAALTFQDFYTSVPPNSRLAPIGDTGAPENDHVIIIGDDDAETIVGSSVRDEIFSGGGDDTLTGGAGGDYLNGLSGEDTASYASAHAGVIASLANSAINTGDAAGDTYSWIEHLTGSDFDDALTGNNVSNSIDGGAGIDIMSGMGGDDAYRVNHADDIIQEIAGGGLDIVLTSTSYELKTGVYVEQLWTTSPPGTGAINLTGNEFANTLLGNWGSNVLNGGAGIDTIYGHNGDDTLLGGAGADVLNGGADSDVASYLASASGVIASLANPTINTGDAAGDTYTSIENLTGSSYDDALNANDAANIIDGGDGADTIKSYQGSDTLTGGSGNDNFVFNTTLDAVTNVDTITDFNVAADTVQVDNAIFTALTATGTLAVSAFKDIAAAPKDADDRIIYNSGTGNLYYDADGSGAAFGNVKFAALTGAPAVTAADFVVI
jgi:Ca2+-binding RTX toxin-like protein